MRFRRIDKPPKWIEWPLLALLSPVIAALLLGIGVNWLCEKAAEHKLDTFGPYKRWQVWFAWHPVRITCWADHSGETVWLERVERRLVSGEVEYKTLGDEYEAETA